MMCKWRVSLFTFLLVGALGLVFLLTSSAHADCPDGMTSYWKLDETTAGTYADFINSNDGTGNVAPTTGGIVNGAQAFDGSTGIEVPGDRAFDWYRDESFSIEYWVKRDDTVLPANNEIAVGRNDVRPTNDLHWWTGITTGEVASFTLRAINGDSFSVTGTEDVVDGAWHHVVAVRDAGANVLRLYVDGALDNTTTNANYGAGFKSILAKLTIGWLEGTGDFYFNGALDEVALYDRALPLTEIQQHHADGVAGQDYCPGGAGPFPKELISYWKLDETSGSNYDDSFNGNDGDGNVDPSPTTGGIVNGAQEFDDFTTGIDVLPDRSFDWYSDESFSIEYWLKRDDTAVSHNEIAVGRNDGVHWWTGITTGEVASFTLRDNDNVSFTVTGTEDVVDGAWHHVVAVRDAGAKVLRLYVDGALDNTTTDAIYGAGFGSTTGNMTMGYLESLNNFHFNGALDEVALYDRALPLAEIQQHHADGVAGWGIGYIPVAGFTADPISGVYPLPVNFTDQSTGNITSWSWDFGDGSTSTSTDQNPTYTYDNVGTYTVSLTVTGPYGTDAETKTDYIVVADTAPVANFTADPISGAYPLTVNFTDGSTGNITSWSWDFGDGLGTSTQQNPSYTYDVEGSYTVSLTVISPGGSDTETKTAYITVEKKKSSGGGGGCFINTIAE